MMSPLRIPNISRNRRDQCRRRVKCDKQDLPCLNCMSPELDCTYLKGMVCNAASSRPQSHTVPISYSKSGSSPWQGGVNSPESKHSRSRQVNDMELIHKYSTETYRSLSANDSENSI
ncbi:Zn(2)-C6 fungal-type DNA-binding domain [Penicillium roqueforti FM164]|uniref:Zn(2)-C6 fungal-type DNA-binding domain n=1 Tax=Penicillium roqueforti (strain FM164) TaxID=1365484 RepID=W6Q9C5_PENRF|nr:Zn(2)-C6 fungal-type DNA-binding domain [Penicillium roqueforti FM164]